MTYIKSLNPFDKGFFGSTLMGARKPLPRNFKPSKVEFDSVDDFNKHFQQEILHSAKKNSSNKNLPKTQNVKVKRSNFLLNMFSNLI